MKLKHMAIALVLLAVSTAAGTQEPRRPGDVALVATVNPSTLWVGTLIHASPRLAIRPGFLVYYADGYDSSDPSADLSDTRLGAQLDLLYFLSPLRSLSFYLGPRAELIFTKQVARDTGGKTTTTSLYPTGALLLGAQYMVSERFGFFANYELEYTRSYVDVVERDTAGNKTADDQYTRDTVKTTGAALGALFFLN